MRAARTDGPDLVYRLEVGTRSHVHAAAVGTGITVLSLRARCGEMSSELACGATGASACASAIPLPLGPSAGSTRGTSSVLSGTCVASGPEAIERLVLAARSHVVIRSQQWFEGGIYLRRDCADWHTELACSATDGAQRDHALIDLTLDAGTYYVFVDGERAGQAGTYTLDVEATVL